MRVLKHISVRFVLAGLFGFVIGLLSGASAWRYVVQRCASGYEYINPLAVCEGKPVLDKSHPVALQEKIERFIEEQVRKKYASTVSVYFRDLRSGPVLGINEGEEFIPASLLKLPLAITYLRLAESKPEILQLKLLYSADNKETSEVRQTFQPSRSAEKDNFYTIEELLFMMSAYSDNISQALLHKYLGQLPGGQEALFQTYRELGFIDPSDPYSESVVNTHTYSSVFRLLHNASYLSADSSEKLLDWMSQSDFKKGLAAGLPASVKVAHKFGERELMPAGIKQLHDCGVIYYPENPYLLCVMTKGGDWDRLSGIISAISRLVYEEMEAREL